MPHVITTRDPFHEMRSLMRRTFDDNLPAWLDDLPSVAGRPLRVQTIPLDVYETADGLAVEASLPGFDKADVEVTLEKGTLSIRAEKQELHEEANAPDEPGGDDRTYFLRERRYGLTSRSILIGDNYDADSIEGSLKDGVLSVRLRKAEAAQPKRVAIRAG